MRKQHFIWCIRWTKGNVINLMKLANANETNSSYNIDNFIRPMRNAQRFYLSWWRNGLLYCCEPCLFLFVWLHTNSAWHCMRLIEKEELHTLHLPHLFLYYILCAMCIVYYACHSKRKYRRNNIRLATHTHTHTCTLNPIVFVGLEFIIAIVFMLYGKQCKEDDTNTNTHEQDPILNWCVFVCFIGFFFLSYLWIEIELSWAYVCSF